MGIPENLTAVRRNLPQDVCLVAVSKTKPDADILEAYASGQRDFGENKVQDLAGKQARLPADIRWHMIGHLQSNKVKYLASFVHLIHGVDSFKLLQAIHKEGEKNRRVIDCLLQVHIARETTKFGLSRDEVEGILLSGDLSALNHVRIRGLMGMATFTDDRDQVREEFRLLRGLFDGLKAKGFAGSEAFDLKSYGMSGDYDLAVEEGSNMVRIGSLIFGSRSA
ncbi:MAG: YggS family pyridoxal phosphate-dependent enzyme [Bacteroidales bacterium]